MPDDVKHTHQLAERRRNAGFFHQFTVGRRQNFLSRLHLAAGKGPHAFLALHQQNLAAAQHAGRGGENGELAAAGHPATLKGMCGLYSFRRSPEEARSLFGYLETPEFPPRKYVTPGGPIAIVVNDRTTRHFLLVRWGLIPSWVKEVKPGKPLINARAETILEKPSFRNAMKRRRCLIPADGYYDWEGDTPGRKQAHFIHRPDDVLFAFAGIWEHWQGADGSELESAAIITAEPGAQLAKIRDRAPVVIHPQDFECWLNADACDEKQAAQLLRAVPDDYFAIEATTIERSSPPPKPKPPPPQLDLF